MRMSLRQTAFDAIGTHWDLQVQAAVSDGVWARLLECIFRRLEAFDKTYSRFRSDSLITRMSQTAGEYRLPPDGYRLLSFYERLYKATDGKVTPLIGQLMADAGYDADYSLQPKRLRRSPAWENVITYTTSTLSIKQPALLDFGAAGKGYLVDIIGKILARAGLRSYTINAGGDILHRTKDSAALAVGLENPLDATQAIGIVRLHNQSLCASAGSKRKWSKYHHLIDPYEMQSPTEIIGSWVVAGDTLTADGIATALFFTEPAKLQNQFDFTFALLHKDMTLIHAKDFPVKVFRAK